MSKFQSTISTVAALVSIFGAGAAGWKISQDNQAVESNKVQTVYEERITELQKELSDFKQQSINVNPPTPVTLPQPQPVAAQPAPAPVTLPAASAPPPPTPTQSEP